jgi:hypothetical protein
VALVALIATLALLSGCGVTSNSGTIPNGAAQQPLATVTPATTPTSTLPANTTANTGFCPTAEQPADAALPPADIVVPKPPQRPNPTAPGVSQTISVKTGQSIEFLMPSGQRWTIALRDSSGTLQPQGDRGWYDAAQKACVWRFVAVRSGNPAVMFTGMIGCKPPEMCAEAIFTIRYNLTITAS